MSSIPSIGIVFLLTLAVPVLASAPATAAPQTTAASGQKASDQAGTAQKAGDTTQKPSDAAKKAADAKAKEQAAKEKDKGKDKAVKPVVAPKVAPQPVTPAPAVPPPPGYLVGTDDVLQVLFRDDKEMSAEVTVRPDGMISLPMLNDVQAAGLTPEQLREKVTESAKRFISDPTITVIVKQINSRRVFITGQVGKPGPYPLTGPMTVLQLIAVAGGLSEFAKGADITVMRTENGKPVSLPFNYKDVTKRKNLKQNIELKPGDTVIVP